MKSAVRQAEFGLGDGTIYASATTAAASQANSTFTLTGFSFDALTGADTDDLMNGYLLYFPASGNKYHVVDWVAATDTATTHEMPQITDTGACEFRRALFDNKALASNPLLYAADGRRDKKWESSAATTIYAYLPNFVENGGFENTSLAPWEKVTVGGTTDITGVNTTTPILGTHDLKLDKGDRTRVLVQQPMVLPLKQGLTYRILFKARHVGTFSAGNLSVNIMTESKSVNMPVNFLSPSSGTVTTTTWSPGLTSTNAWHFVDFSVNNDINAGAVLRLEIMASPVNFNIDEIYVFEKINVSTFVSFGRGSKSSFARITANKCAPDRANFTATVEDTELVGATDPISGKVAIVEFTAVVAPVYSISLTGVLDLNMASEILLSEKWAWQFNPDMPFDADSIEYDEKTIKSRSGVEKITRHSKKRTVKGKYSSMSAVERAILKNDFFPHHIDEERHPFAYRLNSTDTPLFVRVSQSKFGLSRSSGLRDDWDFAFDEVL